MNPEVRYHGIYRGTVVATNDPEGQGRVTLTVPQVSGTEVTNWAWPIVGVPENRKVPYGSFYDYNEQFPGTLSQTGVGKAADTPTVLTLFSTDDAATQFVFIDGPNTSQITFEKKGIYNFQWSGQFENDDNATQNVKVWLRQGNNSQPSSPDLDIPGSTGFITIPARKNLTNPGHAIVGWNYLINANAGDWIELVWSSSSTLVTIKPFSASTTSPNIYPSTASLVATVTLSGGFIPLSGDSCWVMFEGGDPNFPLWLGTF